jgi:hypothetical protein
VRRYRDLIGHEHSYVRRARIGPSNRWRRRTRPADPADQAPVNPGNAKAEMGYLRSVHHQNRSVAGRLAGAGFVDQLAQRIGGSPPRPLRRQKRRSTRSPSLTQPMYAVTPGYSSTWCEPTQPSNAQPSCLSADSRPAGKPDSSWARRSANSTPACSREEQNLPGHRRLLFRDCGARVGRAAIDRFCSGPRQSRPRARWFVESLSMPLSC